jgi:hypothetical protein
VGGRARSFAQAPAPDTLGQRRPEIITWLDAPLLQLRQSAETGTVEPVQREPVPDALTVFTTQDYYHTDNLFLTTPNPQHANAWFGTVGASFVPYSTYRWTPRLTVEASLVRFDQASRADYNSQALALNNRLGLTRDNLLSWYFDVSARRSEGEHAELGEFYKRVEVANSLNWYVPLDHTWRWALQLTPSVLWRNAHPDYEDRLDAVAFAGFMWWPSRVVTLEPFFEAGYAYYPNDSATLLDRRDVHLRAGLTLLWLLGSSNSVGLSAYWLGNYSSAAGADYQLLPYVSLGASFGF